jgi:hypothetical protein
MFQVYVPNISSISDECCKRFHLGVVKVDLDVAYTCMIFLNYNIYMHVASICFKCFICLLQLFYLDVAYVYNGFKYFQVILQVFETHVSSV